MKRFAILLGVLVAMFGFSAIVSADTSAVVFSDNMSAEKELDKIREI